MSRALLFNKPFHVMCQFTDKNDRSTLSDYITVDNVYAAGRLDYDSEGLLILTDDGSLQHRLANPRFKLEKTYWAQVEGEITETALEQLRQGITLKDGPTRPAKAQKLSQQPEPWPRHPPIRERANIPTSWIELKISEGRNRQVRRMTAHVGFPTLRLIRYAIGPWTVDGLQPGQWQEIEINLPKTTAPAKKSNGQRPRSRHPRRR